MFSVYYGQLKLQLKFKTKITLELVLNKNNMEIVFLCISIKILVSHNT